jgi:hypothetical protein
VASVVVVLLVVAGTAFARTNGLPTIDSRHITALTYTATCKAQTCDIRLDAVGSSGRSIRIPETSTLTFGCGSDKPQFTLYTDSLEQSVRLGRVCNEPRLVAAWPTVMGLPPGRHELKAVRVRNA